MADQLTDKVMEKKGLVRVGQRQGGYMNKGKSRATGVSRKHRQTEMAEGSAREG